MKTEVIMGRSHTKSSHNKYLKYKSLDEFNIIESIGSGGYSEVHLAVSKQNNKKYALKCAHKIKNGKDKSHRTKMEIKVLEYLDNPGIIKLHGWFEDEERIYLVLEYLKSKDLTNFFLNKLPRRKDLIYITKQIIESVMYCHETGIVHRDIKLDNILIDKSTLKIKITDFGLCARIKPDYNVFHSKLGTARYLAPELLVDKKTLKSEGYDKSVDVWAIGIVLFKLITGKYPFDGDTRQKIEEKITQNNIDYSKYNFAPEDLDLLENILVSDPWERFSLEEILEHEWFDT